MWPCQWQRWRLSAFGVCQRSLTVSTTPHCHRLATLQGTLQPRVEAGTLLVFAGDHGISAAVPGVSAYPRSVTPAMFATIAAGKAASNVLAATNGCRVILVDVGVDADVSSTQPSDPAAVTVLHRKVRECMASVNLISFAGV